MLRILEFQDKRYAKLVGLSARHTGHLYPPPPEILVVLTSARRRVDPSATVRAEGLSQ